MKKLHSIADSFVRLAYPDKDNFAQYFAENIEYEGRHDKELKEILIRAEKLFNEEEYVACAEILSNVPEYSCFWRAVEIHYV